MVEREMRETPAMGTIIECDGRETVVIGYADGGRAVQYPSIEDGQEQPVVETAYRDEYDVVKRNPRAREVYMVGVDHQRAAAANDADDVSAVADVLIPFVRHVELPDHPESATEEHLREMLGKMKSGEVRGEKANRWLGWVQGVIVSHGGAELEDMKSLNRCLL